MVVRKGLYFRVASQDAGRPVCLGILAHKKAKQKPRGLVQSAFLFSKKKATKSYIARKRGITKGRSAQTTLTS